MADIILNKPEAGTQAVFEAAGDSRIDLNFPTDQATLERSGNDLIFRFDDGSTVVLRDFYTAYTKDSMRLRDRRHSDRGRAILHGPERTRPHARGRSGGKRRQRGRRTLPRICRRRPHQRCKPP